jgi:RNA polymerase II subunit A C-terminal domain phosphatase
MVRLLREKRLSLVVDLDQTVLHATVDPGVHEWLHDSKHPLHQYTDVSLCLFQ